jgi:hypothetical protein
VPKAVLLNKKQIELFVLQWPMHILDVSLDRKQLAAPLKINARLKSQDKEAAIKKSKSLIDRLIHHSAIRDIIASRNPGPPAEAKSSMFGRKDLVLIWSRDSWRPSTSAVHAEDLSAWTENLAQAALCHTNCTEDNG